MKATVKTAGATYTHRILIRLFAVRESLRPSNMLQDRRTTVSLLLVGTFFVVSVLFLLLLISWLALGNGYIVARLVPCAIALAYLVIARMFLKKGLINVTAWMLIGLYAFLASLILLLWSINAPVGILTLGFVIILAGVLIGARYILPVTLAAVVLLISLQFAAEANLVNPDHTSLTFDSTFGDVASYAIIFFIFAVVSWLSGRRMELALKKAQQAEAELEKEKSLLAVRLEEQTKRLRESQLMEIQQVYHFAEIGQQSTAVLHELANHLAALTLDMNDIEEQHRQSKAVTRARESIDSIDDMIRQVRAQLQESRKDSAFDAVATIRETVATMEQKARKAAASLTFKHIGKESFQVYGDALKLSQIASILVSNAIDAYSNTGPLTEKKRIIVSIAATTDLVTISVSDFGIGIPKPKRKKLFKPHQSIKKDGLGIGLYIAHSMTESHFHGILSLDPRTDRTEFRITIPRIDRHG